MEGPTPAILIMTKVPQPGAVKTRLRPFLSDDKCAELSECFLADTVSKALHVTPNVIVAYSAIVDGRAILDLLPASTICIEQHGNDLGERLLNAIDFAELNGCGPIIVIGTDSPTMPLELLKTSLRQLEEPATELVLGGTEDGGYYLIGVRRNIPSIFQNIPWSSDRVYRATLQQANQARLAGIVELPTWYDIDTPNDLRRLFAETHENADAMSTAPETFGWLCANEKLFT